MELNKPWFGSDDWWYSLRDSEAKRVSCVLHGDARWELDDQPGGLLWRCSKCHRSVPVYMYRNEPPVGCWPMMVDDSTSTAHRTWREVFLKALEPLMTDDHDANHRVDHRIAATSATLDLLRKHPELRVDKCDATEPAGG